MPNINYVPRVTQIDAVQLDDEVINIFKAQLLEASKYLPPGYLAPLVPELDLLVRSLVFKYSIYKNGCTFGQKMLSLQYDSKLLSNGKLGWFFFYTVLLKYARDRLLLSYTTNRKVQNILDVLERFQIIGDFFNLLRFLQTGKCPSLIDYILNLEVSTDKTVPMRFTDNAWTRELLWHSFVEVLGFAAPLVNLSFVRRIIKERSLNIFRRSNDHIVSSFINTKPDFKRSTKCAECGHHPILPHSMGCEHVFCHYCLQANKLDNPHYKCPRCSLYSDKVMRVSAG